MAPLAEAPSTPREAPDPARAAQAALRIILGEAGGEALADLGSLRGPRYRGILGLGASGPPGWLPGAPPPADPAADLAALLKLPPAPAPRHALLLSAAASAGPALVAWPRALVTLADPRAVALADLQTGLPADQAARLGLLAGDSARIAPSVPSFDLILSMETWRGMEALPPLASALRAGGRLAWYGYLGESTLADLAARLLARAGRGDVAAPVAPVAAALGQLAAGTATLPPSDAAMGLARQAGYSWGRVQPAAGPGSTLMALRAVLGTLLEVPEDLLAPCLPDWAWEMAQEAAPPVCGWLVCGRDWA